MTDIFPDPRGEIDRREASLLGVAFAFLGLASVGLAIAPSARMGAWTAEAHRYGHFALLPLWLACAWLARRVVQRHRPGRDPLLLPAGYLLAGWGTLLIWRLLPEFGARQAGWLVVATVVLVEFVRRSPDLSWLRDYKYVWLAGGVLLTALTFVFGTNPSGGEPRLWLGCCGVYFQPSELLRLLLIVYLAGYIADRYSLGRQTVEQGSSLSTVAPLVVVWGVSVLLLAAQRDLGTGTLFLALLAVLLYLASGRWQIILLAGSLALLGGLLGYYAVDVVHARMVAWLQPWLDPTGNAYQVVQSLIAVGSGGVLGQGPGLGAPGFVPAAHTDFIFASVAEEWGLLGGLAMMIIFAVLVSRGLKVSGATGNAFASLLAAGVSVSFGLQSVLIIGGVIRLLPLTGVTLPFVSYGGSSLLTSFVALAFLIHVSDQPSAVVGSRPALGNIQGGMALAWLGLALTLGWWSVVAGAEVTARTDNPRRALASRYSPRGEILDRNGVLLAATLGEKGDYARSYPYPEAVSVVGYASPSYGRTGIEASMDAQLRGVAGNDAWLTAWKRIVSAAPPPGLDVRLALDVRLQTAAADLLGERQGAVVVMEAVTGRVLAAASSPRFDPNRLDQQWRSLIDRDDAPLLNRAVQGRYQPGTALGPFVLAWAEEQDMATADELTAGLGQVLVLDGERLSCARPIAAGLEAPLSLGIRLGCPAPIVEIADRLGASGLSDMTSAFGLDQPVGLQGEVSEGFDLELPVSGQGVRSAALGQGELLVSPLQMARGFAALVSDGYLPNIGVVTAVRQPGEGWEAWSEGSRRPAVDPTTARGAQQALRQAGRARARVLARAVSGEVDLSWYLGAALNETQRPVVVVALEGGSVAQAALIGDALVDLLRELP